MPVFQHPNYLIEAVDDGLNVCCVQCKKLAFKLPLTVMKFDRHGQTAPVEVKTHPRLPFGVLFFCRKRCYEEWAKMESSVNVRDNRPIIAEEQISITVPKASNPVMPSLRFNGNPLVE